jgi:hypothetical protein
MKSAKSVSLSAAVVDGMTGKFANRNNTYGETTDRWHPGIAMKLAPGKCVAGVRQRYCSLKS